MHSWALSTPTLKALAETVRKSNPNFSEIRKKPDVAEYFERNTQERDLARMSDDGSCISVEPHRLVGHSWNKVQELYKTTKMTTTIRANIYTERSMCPALLQEG